MRIILKMRKIGKTLPGPIKNLLAIPYQRLSSMIKWDKRLIGEIAEYFNLSQKETIWLLKSSERLGTDLWHILNPKTKKEIQNFYKITPFSVFELAYWHMTRFQREFRSEIIKSAKGEILDFGAGIGDLCLELAREKFNVDYADLPGITFNFARWLLQKKRRKINMIDLSRGKISKRYDTIYCIDVIEHVLNPKEILEDFAAHLKNSGRLVITNLKVDEILESNPMHMKIDLDNEKFLNQLGLIKTKEPWLWIKSEFQNQF